MRPLLIALVAMSSACAGLAGIDDLVDDPCNGQPCSDSASVENGVLGADTSIMLDDDGVPIDTGLVTTDSSMPPADTGGPPPVDTGTAPPDVTTPPADTAIGCSSAPSPLIPIITSGANAFSIEQHEVTRAQYAAFLAKGISTAGQSSVCTWNSSYVPAGWSAPTTPTDCAMPVTGVDFCDAQAYCKSISRRVCGKIGGGGLGGDGAASRDVNLDQWYRACSNGIGDNFPYAPITSINGFCVDSSWDGVNGFNSTTDVLKPALSAPKCKGTSAPYDGVFDLIGNVKEWQDACNGESGASDGCRARGGSYADSMNCVAGSVIGRDSSANNIGIRCCAP
jgi:formylglycine-generating enzyme